MKLCRDYEDQMKLELLKVRLFRMGGFMRRANNRKMAHSYPLPVTRYQAGRIYKY